MKLFFVKLFYSKKYIIKKWVKTADFCYTNSLIPEKRKYLATLYNGKKKIKRL